MLHRLVEVLGTNIGRMFEEADGEEGIVYRAGARRVARLVHQLPTAPASAGLNPDVAHLVIGATGNIGPRLIEELARMGAKTVVAVSRNPGGRLDALTARLAAVLR